MEIARAIGVETGGQGHRGGNRLAASRATSGSYRPLPFVTQAIAARAERFHREGRHLAAALEYRALAQLDRDDVGAALRWADAFVRGGQRERAAEAYLFAAAALARRPEPKRAMTLARRALDCDPAALVRSRLEAIVAACGKDGEAICEEAARLHVARERFAQARELRELLVEQDPGSVTKTLRAAELGLSHGDPEAAGTSLVAAAQRMHASGRTGEYVRIAETMIAHGRHDPDTTLELVRIYLRRGQVHEALVKLDLLRRLVPARLEVIELAVRCNAALGNTAAALVILRDAVRRRGVDDPVLRSLLERAIGFDARDPGFAAAIRTLADGEPALGPPPPPVWATQRQREVTR
jgi:tetratricopeptide (TPR) repeat protein